MSLISTKDEVFENVKEQKSGVLHLMFDEEQQYWFITIINTNQEKYTRILNKKEGIQFLLQYFLWQENITLESNLDTIQISKKERLLGYIRYLKHCHVVDIPPNITENFLVNILEAFQEESHSVRVAYNPHSIHGSAISFFGAQKDQSFTIDSKTSQQDRINYLLENYLKKPNSVVREDARYYYFDGISFQKEGVTNSHNDYFRHTRGMDGYVEGVNNQMMNDLRTTTMALSRRQRRS